jgi:hypothetical protein
MWFSVVQAAGGRAESRGANPTFTRPPSLALRPAGQPANPAHTDMHTKLRTLILSLALGAAATLPARAAVTLDGTNVQVGGFFSQGWLDSTNNNFPTTDNGGTFDFREEGFNVSTTIGSHLRIGAQVFAQRLGDIGGDQVKLDWADADYNFASWFGLRAGRVKFPKGLYGEALDLDMVRPFVFLPSAIYSPILRDFSSSFNGGMAYGTVNVGKKNSFDYEIFYGFIPMTPNEGVANFYNTAGLYAPPGLTQIKMNSTTGGQLTWNTPIEGLKAVYSYSFFGDLRTDGPFAAYPPVNLHTNIDRFTYSTWSAEYLRGDWTFAAEYQKNSGNITYEAPPVLGVVGNTVGWTGWYVSAARRLSSKWEVGSYFGSLHDGESTTPGNLPSQFQHDLAMSVRYDISEHAIIKLEWHDINGTYQTFNTTQIPNPADKLKNNTQLIAVKTTLFF